MEIQAPEVPLRQDKRGRHQNGRDAKTAE